MADKEYRCEACNGIMIFDAASQMLKCPNCDNQIPIISENAKIEIHALTLDAKRTNKPTEKETKTMECTGCGAKIEVAGSETAAKCPYCDSSYVLASEQAETLVPDALLPFKVDKNDLGHRFGEWIKKKWLAPGELKNLYQRGQFSGLYIPYWGFDADADCPYSAMGGRDHVEHYTDKDGNRRTKTVTDWYYTSGRIRNSFRDVRSAASARFKKGLFKGIEPFSFEQLVPYSPDYFSGYMSENYTIGLEDGHKDAVSQMESELRSMASADVRRRYDRVKDVRIRPVFSNETYKYVMLPVYATSYQFKDKTYTVLVNGQTGKFYGEYPKSPVKIAILVIIAIILLILGLSLGKGSDRGQGADAVNYYAEASVSSFTETEDDAHTVVYDLDADEYLEL